jgi:hypothetical protein
MTKQDINIPALVAVGLFLAGGLVALALEHEAIGAALIGVALGQFGPQPVKAGRK